MKRWVPLVLTFLLPASLGGEEPPRLSVLFLGDNGHHRPLDRAKQLIPVLATRGIDITYTADPAALSRENLARHDCLIVYANLDEISTHREGALLDFVARGGGFVPIHCASYCFRNSTAYVDLVGAQFRSHGTGVFRTQIVDPAHPVMKGFEGFETWDETYVHTLHNEDRKVLQTRREGERDEPWTWVREHGEGRVFYTAYGHDERTWGHPLFHALIERGIRWAAGDDRVVDNVRSRRTDVEPFQYVEANIPFYAPDGRGGGPRGADGWNRMQLPLAPSESMKHMVVPLGFELELFAAEPEIVKPVCMAWDERGRLWIAETIDYPNDMQPEGQGRDRIKICEDTDGDGRADRFTVFADKLSIPTSLTFSAGGIIVHQAPHTLFLKDTDGDDRADVRRVLFSGWGIRDTHAGPSNLRRGLDNWIWGMVGYSGFDGEVGGERHRFTQGFYRFRPDGSQLEYLRTTSNNTWGLGFSEEGLVFGSTANNNPSVYMPVANRYYEKVRGWSASRLGSIAAAMWFYPITDKIRQVDAHGRFTAGAGHALYTARSYPRWYWNRAAFVAGPTGHLAGTFLLERVGSDFVSRNSWNLVASDDEWTAPIMAEVGPDGAVWVIDWYNYIVQHNPTPHGFKTGKGNAYLMPLRDKKHGRIYRIVHRDAPPSRPLRLDRATPEELVATLRNDNQLWRMHAQRLLVEGGRREAIPALLALARDPSVDEIGLNPGVIHALWTLRGLGALDGSNRSATVAAVNALSHPSAGVRRAAVKVLPRNRDSLRALLAANSLADPDAHVRLAAFLTLSELPPSPRAGEAIAAALDRPENALDRWIPEAATSAAATHDLHFLKAVARPGLHEAPATAEVVRVVSEHYARGGPADSIGDLLLTLPRAGRRVTDAVIDGLARGWPGDLRVELAASSEETLGEILEQLSPGLKGQLIKLANRWGSRSFEGQSGEIVRALFGGVRDEKKPDRERIELARQLVEFRSDDAGVVAQLLDVVTPRTSPAAAAGIIDALGRSESSELAPVVLDRLGGLTPAARQAALRVLLRRTRTTAALLERVEAGEIQLTELSLDQRQTLASHPDSVIASRARKLLARGGGLPDPDREKVLERLLPLAKLPGNAALGKEVFTEHCSKCHRHGDEGKDIGPDLTGMAVHPGEELLTRILDPSRSLEGNYRQYVVTTTDGQILTGLLASETRTTVELYDVEGEKHVVLREKIHAVFLSTKSLMPDGFEDQIPEEGLVNLLAFLTRRGKYLPVPLDRYATIVSTRGMFYGEENRGETLIFPDWSPKEFAGVPFRLVDPRGHQKPNVIMLRCRNGTLPPRMPTSVTVPCNAPARAIHLLSGVSGWGSKGGGRPTVSMIVRLHYADGETEDHPLRNGEHFADYVGHFHVPKSKFAFDLRGRQIRYLAVEPERRETISSIEFVKGGDRTAPIVMAVTVEAPE